MLRVGVIGYGYWGPNIVRNFNLTDGACVVAVCDKNEETLKKLAVTNPEIRLCNDSSQVLEAVDIDVVAIVTPVSAHYKLAKTALKNRKHVFVEKPFTATSAQALDLIETAEKANLKIMVDHTFLFTGAVRLIKKLIGEGELGDIYYYDSIRVNLGLFQHDVNVVWDLAPHDFSIMRYLINERPVAINAWGSSHINKMEDIAYVTVHFPSSKIAHFSVNWLSPVKVRTTLIGGEKKMLVWNDVIADDKIKIYDKGVEVQNRQGIYDLLVSYRSGDMWAPKVEQTEALLLECRHFVDCIENNLTPINNAYCGLEVVQMLEACDISLRNKGELVSIENLSLTSSSAFGAVDEEI
ncbi:MAG: Gfo/Idh/MocA family oxidoreductase [Chitinispirillales bacterium]|jgi:predicted dehydrogenase|nr:Gfo/Idh/MocA family oxidoreductase [Chitinispirillales bacterium]